jgi:hypothetical protein
MYYSKAAAVQELRWAMYQLCSGTEAAVLHCPKNKADFQKYRGGSPLEGKFTGDSRKLGIISSDYWEISPPGDFLPNTLGNLLCFRDSVECHKNMFHGESD